VDKEVLFRF